MKKRMETKSTDSNMKEQAKNRKRRGWLLILLSFSASGVAFFLAKNLISMEFAEIVSITPEKLAGTIALVTYFIVLFLGNKFGMPKRNASTPIADDESP